MICEVGRRCFSEEQEQEEGVEKEVEKEEEKENRSLAVSTGMSRLLSKRGRKCILLGRNFGISSFNEATFEEIWDATVLRRGK